MIKLSIDQPIELKNDTPLKVELVEKKKKKKPKKFLGISLNWCIRIIILAITIVIGIVWLRFVYPKVTDPYKPNPQFVDHSICYPTYLAVSDKGIIQLTLSNNSIITFNEVKSSLIYNPNEIPIVINSNDGSNIIDFGTIDIGKAKTRKIEFQLNPAFNKNEIFFELKITAQNMNKIKPISRNCKIKVLSEPLRLLLNKIFFIFILFMNALITLTLSEIGKIFMKKQ